MFEVVWHGFLHKTVKGGLKRKNAPDKNNQDGGDVKGEQDWSFKISNADLCEKTKTFPMKLFCSGQQRRCTAHTCRTDNNELRKQLLFDTKSPKWTQFERLLDLDAQQIQRTMMDQSGFMPLLGWSFPAKTEAPSGEL